MHLLRCEPAFRLEFLSADFFLLKVTERRATGRTLRMLILIDVGAVALWLVLGCGAVPCSERSTSNELTPEDLPRQSGDLERARLAAAPIGAVSKPVGESRLCPSRMCRRPGDNRALLNAGIVRHSAWKQTARRCKTNYLKPPSALANRGTCGALILTPHARC